MDEVCASFLLIFSLKPEGGKLKGFKGEDKDKPEEVANATIDTRFRSIRLDQLSYAEF